MKDKYKDKDTSEKLKLIMKDVPKLGTIYAALTEDEIAFLKEHRSYQIYISSSPVIGDMYKLESFKIHEAESRSGENQVDQLKKAKQIRNEKTEALFTMRIDKDKLKRLKQYALDHDTQVSKIIKAYVDNLLQ